LTNPPDLVRIARDKSELVVVRRGDEAGSFVYGAAAGKKAAAKRGRAPLVRHQAGTRRNNPPVLDLLNTKFSGCQRIFKGAWVKVVRETCENRLIGKDGWI
jgi:hypothetical protein